MIRSKYVTAHEIDGTDVIIIFKEPAGFQSSNEEICAGYDA
ncbi:hypothetical protein Mpal_1275 [Methanosphaerula palustris E1-9c]|uniref:Uncharacterized protein n=1 Tax=Methanosphaerula palustris (strain ATCC BAA-1556 / DSM 19958 / E1-9c) TaxID=521011 RepID=B8GHK4_METPE|nr:hypothetical protein Mpal_1275 [Methanosphaerula palustris E1-9c]